MIKKCWYCGLRFQRHNITELRYCFGAMIDKLSWFESKKTKGTTS